MVAISVFPALIHFLSRGQKKKNWWLRCVMENFQSRVRRWLETICCPRTEPSANAEEEQMCWFAYYWRLCLIERIHFITNNGPYVHLQFKQHITFPETKSKGETGNTVSGGKQRVKWTAGFEYFTQVHIRKGQIPNTSQAVTLLASDMGSTPSVRNAGGMWL